MKLVIDKNSKMPLFLQISQQLRYLILSGKFESGAKLPSMRQLAQFLHVNRNTINNALEILSREGLIEIRQGIGIFVKNRPSMVTEMSESLMDIARDAVLRAREIGYSMEDLTSAIYLVGHHKDSVPIPTNGRYIVFVECNQPVLEGYKNDIEKELNIKVIPYLLDELHDMNSTTLEIINQAEVVVTTYTHLYDVKSLLKDVNVAILAITAGPYVNLLMRVSSWPRDAKVTIVMVRKYGALEVGQSLFDSGLVFDEIIQCGLDTPEYEKLIDQSEYLIISSAAFKGVEKLIRPDQKYVIYENVLDQASLDMLKKYLG